MFVHDEAKGPNDIIFRPNQIICRYNGQHITNAELNNRYHQLTGLYAAKLSNNEIIDSALERGVGTFANTRPNHNNASLAISHQNHTILYSIKASRNIRNNQEIYLSYGPNYRMPQDEDIHY